MSSLWTGSQVGYRVKTKNLAPIPRSARPGRRYFFSPYTLLVSVFTGEWMSECIDNIAYLNSPIILRGFIFTQMSNKKPKPSLM